MWILRGAPILQYLAWEKAGQTRPGQAGVVKVVMIHGRTAFEGFSGPGLGGFAYRDAVTGIFYCGRMVDARHVFCVGDSLTATSGIYLQIVIKFTRDDYRVLTLCKGGEISRLARPRLAWIVSRRILWDAFCLVCREITSCYECGNPTPYSICDPRAQKFSGWQFPHVQPRWRDTVPVLSKHVKLRYSPSTSTVLSSTLFSSSSSLGCSTCRPFHPFIR